MVWGDDALPEELRGLASLCERLGLLAVGSLAAERGEDSLAYRSPDDLEVGWPSLAASATFRQALGWLPEAATHTVYLDLQQLVESALRVEAGPRAVRERVMRGLSLDGLLSAIVALTPEGDDGWRGEGVILTTGTGAGVPGLLTAEVQGRTSPPVVDVNARAQVEAFCDPSVVQRIVAAVTSSGERTLFSGLLSGPARALDSVVSQLEGRASVAFLGASGFRAAARVRDEAELRKAMDQLLAPLSAAAPDFECRDGWAVATSSPEPSAWSPPTGEATASGPFVWLRFETNAPSGVVTVELRRKTGEPGECGPALSAVAQRYPPDTACRMRIVSPLLSATFQSSSQRVFVWLWKQSTC